MTEDTTLGAVLLNESSKLVFTVGKRDEQEYAEVQNFWVVETYSGPHKSSLRMDGETLLAVIRRLQELLRVGPAKAATTPCCEIISRRHEATLALSIVLPSDLRLRPLIDVRECKHSEMILGITIISTDDQGALPEVDIREVENTQDFHGPTNMGILFSWDKLAEVLALLQVQAERIGAKADEHQ